MSKCRSCHKSVGKPHADGCPNKGHYGVKAKSEESKKK